MRGVAATRFFGIFDIKRAAVCAAAVIIFAAAALSHLYIAAEAGHDCSGADCPICACVRLCENILSLLEGGTSACVFAAAAAFFTVTAVFSALCGARETPVSIKVRLNN